MPSRFQQHRTFLAEFRRNFHTTGAILPSGRQLAAALTRHVASTPEPRRILEAGPGTGAVTQRLLSQIGPADHVDLVEWNPAFVELLQERFRRDPLFQPAAERCRVIHDRLEALPGTGQYDLIISGLPLNNFEAELVESILGALGRLARPGGMISFFEYVAIRRVRAAVSRRQQRQRLRGIDRAIGRFLADYGCGRELVWRNVPPAWVHHARTSESAGLAPHRTGQVAH